MFSFPIVIQYEGSDEPLMITKSSDINELVPYRVLEVSTEKEDD